MCQHDRIMLIEKLATHWFNEGYKTFPQFVDLVYASDNYTQSEKDYVKSRVTAKLKVKRFETCIINTIIFRYCHYEH